MVLSEILDTRTKSWSSETEDISAVSLSRLSKPKAEKNASHGSCQFHAFWCCLSPRLLTISPAVERKALLTQGLTKRLIIAAKKFAQAVLHSPCQKHLYPLHNSSDVSLFSIGGKVCITRIWTHGRENLFMSSVISPLYSFYLKFLILSERQLICQEHRQNKWLPVLLRCILFLYVTPA